MEEIILPLSCDTTNPQSVFDSLKKENGRRLFGIVTQRISKQGPPHMNEKDGLYTYLMWENTTEERDERARDWNQILSVMEEKGIRIRWISYDVLRKVGELLV